MTAAFAFRAWREWRGSLATGAALAAYGGLWIRDWPGWGHPLPGPIAQWQSLVLAIVLTLIAWRLGDRLARALVATGAAYGAALAWRRFAPIGELARGIAMLSAGFAFLLAGLAVNWWLRLDGAPAAKTPQG